MKFITILASAATLGLGTFALAEGHADIDPAVKARQAHMQLVAHNIGVLGGMAQGKADYDADAAAAAASNLNALANMDQASYWTQGTDNATIDGTRALPAIWANMDDFMSKNEDFAFETEAMMDAAGTDLASLQGAMQGLGSTCSACHREYRQRDN